MMFNISRFIVMNNNGSIGSDGDEIRVATDFLVGTVFIILSSVGFLGTLFAQKKFSRSIDLCSQNLLVRPIYASLCISDCFSLFCWLLIGLHTAYGGQFFHPLFVGDIFAVLLIGLKSASWHLFLESLYHVTKSLPSTITFHRWLFYDQKLKIVLGFVWLECLLSSAPMFIPPGQFSYKSENHDLHILNANLRTFVLFDSTIVQTSILIATFCCFLYAMNQNRLESMAIRNAISRPDSVTSQTSSDPILITISRPVKDPPAYLINLMTPKLTYKQYLIGVGLCFSWFVVLVGFLVDAVFLNDNYNKWINVLGMICWIVNNAVHGLCPLFM
uniref:Uncharacterized protein n=1 Tax=Romanomermis culicivorax TaxID=13658 RepID=A0A915IGR9_ROMCU